MKEKAKTTKKQEATSEVALTHLAQDVKTSILIVSVLINLFVLSLWVALQATSQFDSSLASFFLSR